jgi:hypothetical protein
MMTFGDGGVPVRSRTAEPVMAAIVTTIMLQVRLKIFSDSQPTLW